MISPVMNTEERLRASARAAADTVAPGSAPPLRLPEDPASGRSRGGVPGRRRWLRTLTPLAAAAAVAGIVIASLVLTGRTPPGSSPGPASGASALRSIPPYYVALAGDPDAPDHAVIRASATGAVLATVQPPRPYGSFTFVSGAADDRTFVLSAQRWWKVTSGTRGEDAQQRDNTAPVVFFRLRFDPRTRTAQLTRLSRVAASAARLAGIALSPDGTRLALDLQNAEIKVVSLATGSSRHWVWPGSAHTLGIWVGNGKPGDQPLSWAADGRILAFQFWIQSGGITQVRLLDTTSPGGSLRATRPAVSFVGHGQVKTGPFGNSIITPDGTKIVTVASRTRGGRPEVMEFSVRTGQPVIPSPTGNTTSLGPWDVLWADSSGHTLIVEAQSGPSGSPLTGVLRDGRFTPLPGAPANITNVVW